MKQFQNIIASYVDGVVVQSKTVKTEDKKSEDTTNKFLALTWRAFSSLQDMKFEEYPNLVIPIKDNMFKNFSKKLNKMQKIYYGKQLFDAAFDKMSSKLNTINAYLSSKTVNPETKKVEYVNTFNDDKTLSIEINVRYKEIEKPSKPAKQTTAAEVKPKRAAK